jgi:hypothetical protein
MRRVIGRRTAAVPSPWGEGKGEGGRENKSKYPAEGIKSFSLALTDEIELRWFAALWIAEGFGGQFFTFCYQAFQ